jgi:hypothetical protein
MRGHEPSGLAVDDGRGVSDDDHAHFAVLSEVADHLEHAGCSFTPAAGTTVNGAGTIDTA